jgi:hypothetical protein
MCLLISYRESSFFPCILHRTYCFHSLKCEARLFRVTPYHFNTEFILRDRKPMIEIWSQEIIIKIVYKHVSILYLTYTHGKYVTDHLQMIKEREVCVEPITYWHIFDSLKRMKVNLVFTDCRIKIIFLFANLLPRLTSRFLNFKQHFSTSEVIIQQTLKRKHYFLIMNWIQYMSVY